MDPFEQVRFVVRVLVFVGPLGVYFVWLGLLGSRPTTAVSGRADFAYLAAIFSPTMLAALYQTASILSPAAVGAIMVGLVCVWRCLMPRPGTSWVLYNITLPRLETLLARRGWTPLEAPPGHPTRAWQSSSGVVVQANAMALLRVVTLSIRHEHSTARDELAELVDETTRLGQRHAALPGAAGAGLVLAGSALLLLPLTLVAGHMPAVAEVVRRLLG